MKAAIKYTVTDQEQVILHLPKLLADCPPMWIRFIELAAPGMTPSKSKAELLKRELAKWGAVTDISSHWAVPHSMHVIFDNMESFVAFGLAYD